MIRQIKYNRCFGRIIDNLMVVPYTDNGLQIIQHRINTTIYEEQHAIIHINTRTNTIYINDYLLLEIFNIKYNSIIHEFMKEYLNEYSYYKFVYWGGAVIKF